MPGSLSAVQAISPAFEHTKRQLFQPLEMGRWMRLAVVSFVTGEFAGGGWSGANVNLQSRGNGGRSPGGLLLRSDPVWDTAMEYLPWLLLAFVGLICLGLIWLYVASVFRFILLDAVLTNRCRLREGWRRWQQQGSSYFLWQIGFSSVLLVVLAVVVGIPVYVAWREGIFRQPDQHLSLLYAGGILLFFVALGLILLGTLVSLLAKDFVVPVMALESRGVLHAWREVLPMFGAEKLAYAGYVLMKIVLAVGSAILFGILDIIALLVLLIPLGFIGLVLFLAAGAVGLTLNPYTVGVIILFGLVALGLVVWAICMVSTPAMVFFQSYTLHFLAGRYPVLATLLWRLPPAPPAPAG